MKYNLYRITVLCLSVLFLACGSDSREVRIIEDFNFDWQFKLGDHPEAKTTAFKTDDWRTLNLPHDWSIEGEFSKDHPAKPEGGALPTGVAWYRKSFTLPEDFKNKSISIEFDGVYRKSEVWINGHYLGIRPNGYIAFAYDLSEFLKFGEEENIIAVKVDNSEQPNSRWYSGSGIYRNVRLVITEKLHVAHWGTYVFTPEVSKDNGKIKLEVTVKNDAAKAKHYSVETLVLDANNLEVAAVTTQADVTAQAENKTMQSIQVFNPILWDVKTPYLYTLQTNIYEGETLVDNYKTPLGFRFFEFDTENGFSLNGEPTKIHGVCLHHDNGALGAVANRAAIKRKLQIMKDMGVNAIRVSHNPSSVELLELCDEMGFIVQVEAFDVWKKKKLKADYNMYWDDWYKQDLQDFVKRDRNYPSVFMWSIGNEIREQFDSTGIAMTKDLVKIVKALDKTRPVTCALTENIPEKNFIYQSGALDLLGFNYKHEDYGTFPENFKGQKIIASESVSALETRGHYDATSSEIKFWPPAHNEPFDGNDDFTVTAYDNVAAYWGTTHEENWKTVKKLDYIAGTFIWTGFDYLGEPIPYPYPARSSYFGIVDLAGLPKDIYYMYQSEWSDKNVLHVLPHWNWNAGEKVDVWAYYNNADEVELFVNGTSQGVRSKQGEDLHVSWNVPFEAGTLKVVSRKNGEVVLEKEILTAGAASTIELEANTSKIKNDNYDLVYVTVNVQDNQGNLVPNADNDIHFEVSGGGKLVGVDNGYQASLESFKSNQRKAYNGKCIAIIQSNGNAETIQINATSKGLKSASIQIKVEQ